MLSFTPVTKPKRAAKPEVPEGQKWCVHCSESKPVDAFGPNPRASDRLSSWCRPCHVSRTATWRTENHEEVNRLRRERAAAERAAVQEATDAGIAAILARDTPKPNPNR
jgi:hypothetical protein